MRLSGHNDVVDTLQQQAFPADIDCCFDGVSSENVVPIEKLCLSGCDLSINIRQVAEEWDEISCCHGEFVHLEFHHVDRCQVSTGTKDFLDARCPHLVTPGVVQRIPVLISIWHGVVVGGAVKPFWWVGDVRESIDREKSVPLISPVTWDGN